LWLASIAAFNRWMLRAEQSRMPQASDEFTALHFNDRAAPVEVTSR